MTQHDYNVTDAAGTVLRGDINDVLVANVGLNSGLTAPTVMFPYMWWADHTTGLLKQRNGGNSAWATIGVVSATNFGLAAQLSRPVTQAASSSWVLTEADNGKAFVFNQSCAVTFPPTNSLTNGWNVMLYNMAPSSLSPLICVASKWDGDGTELHLQARAGGNRLEVTHINSVFYTSRRTYLTDPVSGNTHRPSSFHLIFHGLAAKPRGVPTLHLTNVASELGYDRERIIYPMEVDNTFSLQGMGAQFIPGPGINSFGVLTGNRGWQLVDRPSFDLADPTSSNKWNTRFLVSY